MKVFISWSKDQSRELSSALKEFLEGVFQKSLKVWVSHEDITMTSRWQNELNKELEGSNIGMLCLTPENVGAPWLLFEAGALAKSVSSSIVVPYYLGLKPADIPDPLKQFQSANAADEKDTYKLVKDLNKKIEAPLDETELSRIFNDFWPSLNARIEAILDSANPYVVPRSPHDIKTEREGVWKFSSGVIGSWWEHIDDVGIGYFEVRFDELYNSVELKEGKFYDTKGEFIAYWKSAVALVVKSDKEIHYLRQCWKPSRPKEPWFHGFGKIGFEESSELFSRGYGSFWDVDPIDPEKMLVHAVGIRRIEDKKVISEMQKGNSTERQAQVLLALKEFGEL